MSESKTEEKIKNKINELKSELGILNDFEGFILDDGIILNNPTVIKEGLLFFDLEKCSKLNENDLKKHLIWDFYMLDNLEDQNLLDKFEEYKCRYKDYFRGKWFIEDLLLYSALTILPKKYLNKGNESRIKKFYGIFSQYYLDLYDPEVSDLLREIHGRKLNIDHLEKAVKILDKYLDR